MTYRSTLGVVLTTGFALFSMFFGSGNLVYPVDVGRLSDGHVTAGALGFVATGVLVPAMGVLAILLYGGSYKRFFSAMGCRTEVWFPLLALSLMGPFGVLPRCLTVAHASFDNVIPGVSPTTFVLVASMLIFLMSLRESRLLSLLGAFLTPGLLLALGFILWKALTGVDAAAPSEHFTNTAFQKGFFKGYQTMDLLAAFFFSAFVISMLKEKSELTGLSSRKLFAGASLIGMGLLTAVSVFMVMLGSSYRDFLADVPPESLFGNIALQTLGPLAGVIVCLAVTLACMTTAIALTTMFADYIHEELSKKILPRETSLLLTLAISFLVSTLEFSGIAAFIKPILDVLYPALIVVTLHLILVQLGYWRPQRWLLPCMTVISLVFQNS